MQYSQRPTRRWRKQTKDNRVFFRWKSFHVVSVFFFFLLPQASFLSFELRFSGLVKLDNLTMAYTGNAVSYTKLTATYRRLSQKWRNCQCAYFSCVSLTMEVYLHGLPNQPSSGYNTTCTAVNCYRLNTKYNNRQIAWKQKKRICIGMPVKIPKIVMRIIWRV